MDKTVLILGSSGRFGRHAAKAFQAADWEVRTFDRATDNLWDAAWGASVIVNAWNPKYTEWADQLPSLHARVIEVAKASKSTVIIPGNVYNFGADMPKDLNSATPHRAQNGLGQVRIAMENAYREAGVRTIILRAGDFIDTEASGNWFDSIMIKSLKKGKLTYPGSLDTPHSWAYLPDMAKAAVMLAETRHSLPDFADIPFAGYTLSGTELAQHISLVLERKITAQSMAWLPIQIARPFWPMAKYLLEMRYLWSTPHSLDGTKLAQLCPEFRATDPQEALRTALPQDVHPNQSVTPRSQAIGT